MTVPVAIAGATGYTGQELIRLVLSHPELELAGVFASPGGSAVGQRLDAVFPEFRGRSDAILRAGTLDAIAGSNPEVAFLCTPHEASASLARELLSHCRIVTDLSGAFRLPVEHYPSSYGFEHPSPELLGEAAYALPEHNRQPIADARLLACPGCYPTASLLPLRPVIDAGLLRDGCTPLIDAVSGISGAGRAPSARTTFGEVSLQSYGVFAHRHQPEISVHAGTRVLFTPSVAPFFRGMLALTHVDVAPGVSEPDIRAAVERTYANAAFVRVLPKGVWASVAGVERTNFADISMAFDIETGHAVLACAIDNLLKGASGQAIQAVNIRLGFDERLGLLPDNASRSHSEHPSPEGIA